MTGLPTRKRKITSAATKSRVESFLTASKVLVHWISLKGIARSFICLVHFSDLLVGLHLLCSAPRQLQNFSPWETADQLLFTSVFKFTALPTTPVDSNLFTWSRCLRYCPSLFHDSLHSFHVTGSEEGAPTEWRSQVCRRHSSRSLSDGRFASHKVSNKSNVPIWTPPAVQRPWRLRTIHCAQCVTVAKPADEV
jgi:hypothetical protein